MKTKTFLVLSLLVLMALALGACAAPAGMPAAAPGAAAPADSGAASVDDLTRPNPKLADVKVRQAIAHCLDRKALLDANYTYVADDVKDSLLMDSFLPTSHWAWGGPYDFPMFDLEKANALLDEAGWTDTDEDGYRNNADGDVLQFTLTTTNSQFRQNWAAVVEQQLRECGIALIRQHTPASWWFGDSTGLKRRDFELGAFAWVGQTDPSSRTLYACDQIGTPANNWEGQNGMGWCNQRASDGVVIASNTLDRDERIAALDGTQEEFAADVVSIPLFQRAEAEAWQKNFEGLKTDPTEYGTASAAEWSLADGGDTVVIGFSQEPSTLFQLTVDAAVARQIGQMGIGVFNTQYGYDYQPVLQDGFPTFDSGLATNEKVTVKAGDMVYDVTGNPAELAEGVEVMIDGEKVKYDGTSELELPQLTVTYKWKPYTWSDGTPGSIKDVELAFKINCDRESGATSFNTCDAIQNIEYGENDYTLTMLPGVQDPYYYVAPYSISPAAAFYPSHQVLSDGRNLADVPAAEWQTLPEIAEMPLSFGPYVVTEWVKGQSITLEANPYYEPQPKVKNIVVVFIQDTNQLVAQFLAGDMDYLEKATLAGGPEVQLVADAAAAGNVNFEVIPSPTWEHIDMNLYIKER